MNKAIFILWVFLASSINAQIPDELSSTEKVYGLSKFWQETNYNFIYLNKVDKAEWDALYKAYIPKVQETKNDYEYYRLLQKFCAFLKDGHTNVYFPKNIQDHIFNTHFGAYRLFLSNIEGRAIITRVNKSKKKEIPIGTEISKVNGISTNNYLKDHVLPYISSSTDYIRKDWGIRRLLEGYVGTRYDLELKLPNGQIKNLTLTHAPTAEKEVYPQFEKRTLLDMKWYDNAIAYVALNSFSDRKIDSLFFEKISELKKAKALIVDLRNNGGGRTDIGTAIFKHLTNDSILYGSKTQSRLHIPSFKAWGKWTTENDTLNNAWAKQSYLSYRDEFYHNFKYSPDTIDVAEQKKLEGNRIIVPTVLLIGHQTASAAEDFLIYADNQKHMTKIGEPTFGSTGQPMLFDLPNGGLARICTKKDTYPNGKEFVGVGIKPDIEIGKSLSDYMENKDPVLDKAIEFLNNKK
ncbi:S41 family peptidase [uncultured Croceitalea sp.]|uniref:S41 family peptidase n=1 Tax=uncultured Croceitalea sp. TaxID=1798908 RepID=UPI00330636AE